LGGEFEGRAGDLWPSGPPQVCLLRIGHGLLDLHETVGIQRNGVVAGLHQKLGKLRIINGYLAVDAYFAPLALGPVDKQGDQGRDRLVPFVKEFRKQG